MNPSPGSVSLLGGQGPVVDHTASTPKIVAANAHGLSEINVTSPGTGSEEQQSAAAGGCCVPASPSISSASTLRCGSESPDVEQAAAAAAGGPVAEDGSAHNKYCHFCQHIKVKRASSMLACENRGCNRRFCEHCLQTHLGDTAAGAPAWRAANGGAPWHCPICAKTCCCTQRDCGKTHRHCKAYRYRRKRALIAETDKAPGPAAQEDPRAAQLHAQQARLAPHSFAAPMAFGVMGGHHVQYGSLAGQYGSLAGLGAAIGMGGQMGSMPAMGSPGMGGGNFGGVGGLQLGQLAQMQAMLQHQVALQKQQM